MVLDSRGVFDLEDLTICSDWAIYRWRYGAMRFGRGFHGIAKSIQSRANEIVAIALARGVSSADQCHILSPHSVSLLERQG
jgi:hypothetical protein